MIFQPPHLKIKFGKIQTILWKYVLRVCVYEFNSKRGGKWAVASAFREKEAITKISHVIIFIIIELFVCFKNVLNKIRFTHYS
jgi:hypothetical protein